MRRLALAALILASVVASGSVAAQTATSPRSSPLFDRAALLADLKTLSSDAMNGRAVDSPDGARARAFLAGRLSAAGLKPFGTSFEQPFTFMTGGRSGAPTVERHGVNLVGQIAGTANPSRYIVVTAHYDHLAPRNGAVMNGADDNASGAAALVAITSYFTKHRPANSLIVVACDGEEAGLRGAYAFAGNPPVPAKSLVVNVNLDMIGRDPDDKLFAVGTVLNPYLKPFVEEVAKAAPVRLLLGHDDPAYQALEDWTRDSDHYALWTTLKMPFIYLGVEDESQHHKPTDDYETITYDFYIRAVETSIALIRNFDRNLDLIQKGRPS
jgi:hypothetical protein